MKNLFLLIGITLVASLCFTGCGEDGLLDDLFDKDEKVAVADLPPGIVSYISENYPESTIKEAEREKENGAVIYEVELNTGEELIFDENGTFIGLESEDD